MTCTPLLVVVIGFLSVLPNARADAPTGKIYGLTDLYRSTVDGAETVRSKIEERTQIEETKSQGTGALMPTITGVATYYKAGLPSNVTPGYTGDTQKTVKLTGKEYLFKGTSEYAFLRQTNRLLEGKEAEIDGSRLQYFVDLSAAYYDALLKQALRNHSQTELKLYDNQIGELRSRVKIGRTRASDLLSVQAARAASEARLKAAESDLRISKLALANLARIPIDFDLREEAATNAPLESLDSYLKASEAHPDLVASRKKRDAAEEQIAYQRGYHFPTLDLAGNYYLKKDGYTNDSKWDATLTLTVPIFSGGITQSQVRQAASVYRENEINTGLLERNQEIQVRTLHHTLVASEAELKSFAEAVDLATKAYERIHQDYKFGLVTNLDLLNSLQTLTDAKRNYDQARYQHLLERARLEADAGRIPVAGAS
ncbi:MAG: TolC family protein [Bdellovibrionales bacterium]|nr:TolC family protein [Bdellovibrionales bacterium]